MTQREDGPIPEKYKLWEQREFEGVQWYVPRYLRGAIALTDT